VGGFPGTAVDRFSNLPIGVIVSVPFLPGKGPFPDQRSLEFGRRPENMQQKSRSGVLLIRVEILRSRDEPNSPARKCLDIVQTVHQGTPKAVQFPDQKAVEFSRLGVLHETVQPWPAGLSTADYVLVGFGNCPALTRGVFLLLPKLKFGILIGC
jgi:hypothetical protein